MPWHPGGAGHGVGHPLSLLLPPRDPGEMGRASPGKLHRHPPTGTTGSKHHHPQPRQRRHLLDRVHYPLAVVGVADLVMGSVLLLKRVVDGSRQWSWLHHPLQ